MNHTQAVNQKTDSSSSTPSSLNQQGQIRGREIAPIEPREKGESKPSAAEQVAKTIFTSFIMAKNDVAEFILNEISTTNSMKREDLGIQEDTPRKGYYKKLGLITVTALVGRPNVIRSFARKTVLEQYIDKQLEIKINKLTENEKKCFEFITKGAVHLLTHSNGKEIQEKTNNPNVNILNLHNSRDLNHEICTGVIQLYEHITDIDNLKDSKMVQTAAMKTIEFIRKNTPALMSDKLMRFWKL